MINLRHATLLEAQKDDYTISTILRGSILMQLLICSRALLGAGRTREMIARYVQHSLVFGVYHKNKQIGLARIVSDYTPLRGCVMFHP